MSRPVAAERAHVLILLAHGAALLAGLWFVCIQWSNAEADKTAVQLGRLALQDLDRRLQAPEIERLAAKRVPENPLLQGPTAAVAGANLQDRVVSAIRAAGGTVTSSQLDVGQRDGTASGDTPAALTLTVAFDLANNPLQALLFGIERGTPALFVDRLAISEPEDGRGDALRVSLTVSGFWRGADRS